MKKYFLFCLLALFASAASAQVAPKLPAQPVKAKTIPAAKIPVIKTKTSELNFQASQLTDSIRVFKLAIEQISNDIDSLSEMGEMESLRLQMAMDRLSRLMSTLSNILKKISETHQGIVQNIK